MHLPHYDLLPLIRHYDDFAYHVELLLGLDGWDTEDGGKRLRHHSTDLWVEYLNSNRSLIGIGGDPLAMLEGWDELNDAMATHLERHLQLRLENLAIAVKLALPDIPERPEPDPLF